MKLMLFLGAGVSRPSGLPLADELTAKILKSHQDDDDGTQRVRALLNIISEYPPGSKTAATPFSERRAASVRLSKMSKRTFG